MGAKSSRARQGSTSQQSKLGLRLVKAMSERAASGDSTRIKTFNSIILKFPKIDEALEQVRGVFAKYDKDGNGTIDLEELTGCFKELQVAFTDDEIRAYHAECDMDSNHGIDFKEFIVLLALVYLVGAPSSSAATTPLIGLPQLETTFETIADCFVFFDRDGDGYVTKTEMIYAINEASPGTKKTGDRIGVRRFEEMDWDRDGSISFKEFLFAFTSWVGLEQEGSS